MVAISNEERLVFGNPGNNEVFGDLKVWFGPFREMWECLHEARTRKSEWFHARLIDVDPDDVDALIKESSQTLARL